MSSTNALPSEPLPNGKVTYGSADGVALVTLTNAPANYWP